MLNSHKMLLCAITGFVLALALAWGYNTDVTDMNMRQLQEINELKEDTTYFKRRVRELEEEKFRLKVKDGVQVGLDDENCSDYTYSTKSNLETYKRLIIGKKYKSYLATR